MGHLGRQGDLEAILGRDALAVALKAAPAGPATSPDRPRSSLSPGASGRRRRRLPRLCTHSALEVVLLYITHVGQALPSTKQEICLGSRADGLVTALFDCGGGRQDNLLDNLQTPGLRVQVSSSVLRRASLGKDCSEWGTGAETTSPSVNMSEMLVECP